MINATHVLYTFEHRQAWQPFVSGCLTIYSGVNARFISWTSVSSRGTLLVLVFLAIACRDEQQQLRQGTVGAEGIPHGGARGQRRNCTKSFSAPFPLV